MMEPLIQANAGEVNDVEAATDGPEEDVLAGNETDTPTASTSNDDTEDEIAPPPISSMVTGARFWWKFCQWPLLLAAINVIVLGCLAWSAGSDIDDIFDNSNDDDYNRSHHRKKQIGELSVVVFVIAILLLVDSVLMFRWASLVQNQLDRLELEEGDANSESSSSTLIYGRVSIMADRFLAGNTSPGRVRALVLPKISLLVNACYVGMSLFLAAGLMTAVVAVYLQKRSALSDCIEASPSNAREQRAGNMTNVPAELQEWVSSDGSRYDSGPGMDFAHTTDGTTYFTARAPKTFEDDNTDHYALFHGSRISSHLVYSDATRGTPILMETTNSGALVQHKDLWMPKHYTVFGETATQNENDPSASLFCCVTTKVEKANPKQRYRMNMNDNFIYCYDAIKKSKHEVPALPKSANKFLNNDKFEFGGIEKASSFEGKFWYVAYWYNYHNSGRARNKVQVYSMSTTDFQVKMVGEAELNRNRHFHRANQCLQRLYLWLDIIGYSVLFLSSLILSKWLKLPGGVVPGVVGAHLVLSNIDRRLCFLSSFLSSICLLVCLAGRNKLPAWLNREMATWTLYTCFVCQLFIYIDDDPASMAIPVIFFLFSAFVLNHPILLLLGYVSGFFSLLTTIFVFLDGDADELFWVVLTCTVFSAGAGSLGHTLVKYRGYLVWYSRRLWRAFDNMGTRGAS